MHTARLRATFGGRQRVLMLPMSVGNNGLREKRQRRFRLLTETVVVQTFARHG